MESEKVKLKNQVLCKHHSRSFGIHFTTRPDKAKDGKEPIYACVTVNRQRAYIALKQNVDPKNWDSGKGAASVTRKRSNPLTITWRKFGWPLAIVIKNYN